MDLEARIWAFWIGFGPRDRDLGLRTRIWASKLGGRTDGWMEEGKNKETGRPGAICGQQYLLPCFA